MVCRIKWLATFGGEYEKLCCESDSQLVTHMLEAQLEIFFICGLMHVSSFSGRFRAAMHRSRTSPKLSPWVCRKEIVLNSL